MTKKATNKPIKRFKSAYMYFCIEYRPKLIQSNPGLSSMEISRLLGQEWNKLENKEPYYLLEQKDKEKFNDNKLKGKNKYTYKKSNKIKKPKRFRTAFMFFLQQHKKGLKGNEDIIKQLKEIGKKWKLLSIKDKQVYFNKENEDKIRYKQEYLEYIDKVIKQKDNKETVKTKKLQLIKDIPKIFKRNRDIVNKLSLDVDNSDMFNDKE